MKNKPKIAHVLVPYIQRTETFIYDRLTHHEKYQPFVMTDEPPVNTDILPFEPVFSTKDISLPSHLLENASKRLIGFSPFYYKIIKKEKPAVVHAHYGPVGVSTMSAASAARIPLIVSFYGIDASALLREPAMKKACQRLFSSAAAVSALSENMASGLALAGCPENKLHIHHLALDTDKFQPIPEKHRKVNTRSFSIVSVGRLVPKKGMRHLVSAFKIVQEEISDARLDIYGTGPLERELLAQVEKEGLSNRIFTHGHKNRDIVMEAIRNAHVFALFSTTAPDGDSEGTPTVLIEAGALGIPSVSTFHAGIPEVVVDGKSGFLVAEKDEEAFAAKLLEIARNPSLGREMGTAARAHIESEFDIRTTMARIEETYDQIS